MAEENKKVIPIYEWFINGEPHQLPPREGPITYVPVEWYYGKPGTMASNGTSSWWRPLNPNEVPTVVADWSDDSNN